MELLNIAECEVTLKLDLESCRALAWELGRARREHEFEPLPDTLAAFFEAAAMAAALYSEHSPENRAKLTLARYREHIEAYRRAYGTLPAGEGKDGEAA